MDIRDFSTDLFSLEGKSAIVTGGNTGLGQAFALALAKAGANIFIPTVADDDGETRQLIEAEGRKAEILKIDITGAGAPKVVVAACAASFGAVDILVNSAGICNIAPVGDFDRQEWDPMIALNLTAAFELSYEASKLMIERRSGKIINIASLFSFLGGQWSPAYAATKHGLVGFTKAYCDELARYNVQVNTDRARLFRHGHYRADAVGPRDQPARPRSHSCREVGRRRRVDGRRRVSCQSSLRLCERPRARSRWRIPRPVTTAVPAPRRRRPGAW